MFNKSIFFFKSNKIFSLIISLIVVTGFSFYFTGEDKKNEVLIKLLSDGLTQQHYEPKDINDSISFRALRLYLKRLDNNKKFLLQSDVKFLYNFRYQLDEEIFNGTYSFFNLSNEIIVRRINEASAFYTEILQAPFDLNKNESIELDADKETYSSNETVLKENWRRALKYQTLTKIYEQQKLQDSAIAKKDTSVKILTFIEMEADARTKVLKSNKEWFERLNKIDITDRRSLYINCIVNAFDPHSGYYPPKDKENFDIQMSGRLEGIGANLGEKDGYIKIQEIVPGSASWREGRLKAGDLILKVGQSDNEPVDVTDMRIDDAIKLIRGKKGTEVRLTVKKIDGTIVTIPIIRDVVIIEETFAKSATLNKKGISSKTGYIYLPKFYADFNRAGGRNCADDVKEEIKKLKDESINGLIIDLRNNGGGSLEDVVKIGGLFIKKGPIVQVKSRVGNPYILEDTDTGILYQGPLLIMVNSFSASASEILAAAMQDYNRAVIVGSLSTFGKGTVQRFFNLDDFLQGDASAIKPLGSMMMTIQKFYRINGTTTQLKGVIPDIILSDPFSFIELGEKEHDYALDWDEINPVRYDAFPASFEIKSLNTKSIQRCKNDSRFKIINEFALRLKSQKDSTLYSMKWDKFLNNNRRIEKMNKRYEDSQKEIPELTINMLKIQVTEIEADTVKKERFKRWHEGLKKDTQLYEALSIMNDMD